VPSRTETDYGYIRAGARVEGKKLETENAGLEALSIVSFVEKPGLYTAEEYLESGGFY
jgi:mannose-1-phosphate guanylyltransferase